MISTPRTIDRPRPTRGLAALAATVVALAGTAGGAAAQSTATQTVSFQVDAINQISVSGNPGLLTISSATAGAAPTSATNSATTWAITTNEASKKVQASIDSPMPSGLTLSVNLATPGGGAASAGSVALGTSAADVVTGITRLSATGLVITYTLSATAEAAPAASASRTVTFTVVTGS